MIKTPSDQQDFLFPSYQSLLNLLSCFYVVSPYHNDKQCTAVYPVQLYQLSLPVMHSLYFSVYTGL